MMGGDTWEGWPGKTPPRPSSKLEPEMRKLVDDNIKDLVWKDKPQPSKLDDCLGKATACGSDGDTHLCADCQAQVDVAHAQILALIEEVIGEDFKNWGELFTEEQHDERIKNELRAEQRLRKDAL